MRKPDPRLADGYKTINIKFPKKIYRKIITGIIKGDFNSINDAVIKILENHFLYKE